jgi:small-conductance mechanosensitive channel
MESKINNDTQEVPAMVKLPLAIFSLCIGVSAFLVAGLSFLKSAMPAAEVGNYSVVSMSILGLIAATLGASVLAKGVNDWLVKQVAKVW